ncbi:hypothetical protein CRYUN_Cryun07bG0129900 [Craigia yunnanensis]
MREEINAISSKSSNLFAYVFQSLLHLLIPFRIAFIFLFPCIATFLPTVSSACARTPRKINFPSPTAAVAEFGTPSLADYLNYVICWLKQVIQYLLPSLEQSSISVILHENVKEDIDRIEVTEANQGEDKGNGENQFNSLESKPRRIKDRPKPAAHRATVRYLIFDVISTSCLKPSDESSKQVAYGDLGASIKNAVKPSLCVSNLL